MVSNVLADSSWPNYVAAFATAVAAAATIVALVLTSKAAKAASDAATATQALVSVESARDDRAAEEVRWRQARRVMVEVVGNSELIGDKEAYDIAVAVRNASDDPINKVRIVVQAGKGVWGPRLIGGLAPNQMITVTVRIYTPWDVEFTAYVRFRDVYGEQWVVDAQGNVNPATDNPLEAWIQQGQDFVSRQQSLTPFEQGTIDGMTMPIDFPAWRARVADRVRSAASRGVGYSPEGHQ